MAWKEVSRVSSRREFVRFAEKEDANIRELCRRFGISPTTGYKWLERGRTEDETFEDRSRRPHHSPGQTDQVMEALLLALRDEHPVWNARKIRRLAQRRLGDGVIVPAASTVGRILKRNGRISEAASGATQPWKRFEHEQPNDLWQIDFKGHFPMVRGGRCYPLTMIDDHSRFVHLLEACADERTATVQAHLTAAFRRYGLPVAMNMDNGNPWGNPTGDPYTKLTVWLMRLGISISHSRPLHPQTNGKDERFHRTLDAELLGNQLFTDLADVQRSFDPWREIYNYERPHEAIGLDVPAQRYRTSARSFPEVLTPIEYNQSDLVIKIRNNGMLYAWKTDFYLSQAFAGQRVALRPTAQDGCWDVYFCHHRLATINRVDRQLVRLRRAER
jgi:transposase InsO family protein